jgi:dihydroorotase
VLLDPEAAWTVDPARFHSRGRNTPFGGWTLHGTVLATVLGGRVTHAAETGPFATAEVVR